MQPTEVTGQFADKPTHCQ